MEDFEKNLEWFAYTESVWAIRCEYERMQILNKNIGKTSKRYYSSYSISVDDFPTMTIFNPQFHDFQFESKKDFIAFADGHKKGMKFFKKHYYKKYPNTEQVKILIDKYNNVFKQSIVKIYGGSFNKDLFYKVGMENGILQAYAEYETLYQSYFLEVLKNSDESTPEAKEPFEFKNEFDKVPEDKVYEYFQQKLVETNMLTETEFHQYLKVAFEKVEKPKKKFVLKNSKGKGRTTKIFNDYSKDIAGRASGDLKKYVGLLGDYFEGYENNKTLYSNFNK